MFFSEIKDFVIFCKFCLLTSEPSSGDPPPPQIPNNGIISPTVSFHESADTYIQHQWKPVCLIVCQLDVVVQIKSDLVIVLLRIYKQLWVFICILHLQQLNFSASTFTLSVSRSCGDVLQSMPQQISARRSLEKPAEVNKTVNRRCCYHAVIY